MGLFTIRKNKHISTFLSLNLLFDFRFSHGFHVVHAFIFEQHQ